MNRGDQRLSWLRLANLDWLGRTIPCGLIKECGSPEAVFSASPGQLAKVKGWDTNRRERFLRQRETVAPLCSPELLDLKGIRLVTFNDPEYPELLREIPDAPVVLFALGELEPDPRPHLAIVGARNGSQQGYDIARQFSAELSQAGFVIVSGLALGIDTYAHRGALEAGGRTVAVLGCGVDQIYPVSNRRIRDQIIKSGALLSEFPPGMSARPWHFPVRNRLISGMCVGTLVIEATARSGSLITARLAGEQDRDIFAIPGGIRSPHAEGTLALLDEGAHLVTSTEDLIDFYAHLLPERAPQDPEASKGPGLNEEESDLVSTLATDPISLDRLLADGRWSRDRLFSLLLDLELRDILVKFPGNYYQAKIKPQSGRHNKSS